MADVLYVSEKAPEEERDSVFAVQEELQKVTDEEHDRVYSVLSNSDLDIGVDAPVYGITWTHLISGNRGRLKELCLMYLRLQQVVEEEGPEEIECERDIDRGYASVVKDVGDSHDIRTTGTGTVSRLNFLQRFLKNSFLILPFVFDQVFSLVWRYASRDTGERETVFIPSLARLSSMSPVLDRVEESEYEDYGIICSSKVSGWGRKWKREYLSAGNGYELTPISVFTDVGCILSGLSLYLRVSNRALLGSGLKDELDGLLRSELGIRMGRAIDFSIYEGYRTRVLLSFLFYRLTDSLTDKTGCEKLVVGGFSPSRRAMILSGIENGADVYCIDHGIQAGDCPNPPPEVIHFVSGELEASMYRESPQVKEGWDWRITGRPYLTNVYDEHGQGERETSANEGSIRILVATQTFDVREEFVSEIIRSARAADKEFEIVIKTHPNEKKSVYSEYAEENENVSVVDSDLFMHLNESDLTLTINSNVGVESIIVGTPTVCVNRWRPLLPDASYVRYGSVPVSRGGEDLVEFLEGLDEGRLSEIYESEKEFVHEGFELETDATQNMLDEMFGDETGLTSR